MSTQSPDRQAPPLLLLLAGPNGAGKSTLFRKVLEPVYRLPFVNADAIAAERWPGAEMQHAYDASGAAAELRDQYMAERRSFATETVFSHPSKLDLIIRAKTVGYDVQLHVVAVPPELSISHVRNRVRQGGHDVPEGKIRARFERLWPLVFRAALLADTAVFYDNTSAQSPFRILATRDTHSTNRIVTSGHWPDWLPTPD